MLAIFLFSLDGSSLMVIAMALGRQLEKVLFGFDVKLSRGWDQVGERDCHGGGVDRLGDILD